MPWCCARWRARCAPASTPRCAGPSARWGWAKSSAARSARWSAPTCPPGRRSSSSAWTMRASSKASARRSGRSGWPGSRNSTSSTGPRRCAVWSRACSAAARSRSRSRASTRPRRGAPGSTAMCWPRARGGGSCMRPTATCRPPGWGRASWPTPPTCSAQTRPPTGTSISARLSAAGRRCSPTCGWRRSPMRRPRRSTVCATASTGAGTPTPGPTTQWPTTRRAARCMCLTN